MGPLRGKSTYGSPSVFPERLSPKGNRGMIVEFTFDAAPYVLGGFKLKNPTDTLEDRVFSVERLIDLDINNRQLESFGADVIALVKNGGVTLKFYNGPTEAPAGWLPVAGRKLVLRFNGV